MHRLLLILFLSLASVAMPLPIYASMSGWGVDSLYRAGKRNLTARRPAAALACFHFCSERYSPSLDKETMKTVLRARRLEAQLLFYSYYEFSRASEILASAKRLCRKHGLEDLLPSILLEEAGFYQTYASQNPRQENFESGEKLYREAFSEAARLGDNTTMSAAFSNMANRLYGEGRIEEIRWMFDSYGKHHDPSDTSSVAIYANLLYKGLRHVIARDNEGARRVFRDGLSQSVLKPRHVFELNVAIVRIFLAEKNLDSAISYEHRILDLSRSYGLKDGEAVALRDLANLYMERGDTTKSRFFSFAAMEKKDSLINVRRLDKVHTIGVLQELYELKSEADKTRDTRKWLVAIAVMAVSLAGAAIIVFVRRKKVSPPKKETPQTGAAPAAKYAGSSLNEDVRSILLDRIVPFFDRPDEAVFMQDFNVEALAKRCGSNSRYVSQVINEHYGMGFSALLNGVRVAEACRRIKDEGKYGNMTLEAIGESVGYSSRVSFNNAFKRIKGMTPGQYRVGKAADGVVSE